MVLWEIALGTAYFLGLKRTYRLALKMQRRLISPEYPKIRGFAHRRTRWIFGKALTVHRKVQERDIEVGRNLGNWILRWLDHAKPSAEIRGPTSSSTNLTSTLNPTKQLMSCSNINKVTKSDIDQNRHLFSRVMWSKQFPPVSMMMRSMRSANNVTQFRHFTTVGPELPRQYNARAVRGGVLRKDMMQWMLQK